MSRDHLRFVIWKSMNSSRSVVNSFSQKNEMGYSKNAVNSSLHADCLTKWVKQFGLGIAINRCFECSVFSVLEEAMARHRLFFPEL